MLPLYTRRRCTRSRTSRFIPSTRPENRIKIRVLSREKIFDKFASYSNATLTRTTWKNLLLRRRAQGYANGKNVKSWDGTASRRRKSERNRAKLSPIRFYFELGHVYRGDSFGRSYGLQRGRKMSRAFLMTEIGSGSGLQYRR